MPPIKGNPKFHDWKKIKDEEGAYKANEVMAERFTVQAEKDAGSFGKLIGKANQSQISARDGVFKSIDSIFTFLIFGVGLVFILPMITKKNKKKE